MDRDYAELLRQLAAGEITELEISKEEFSQFQPAFMNFESRKKIVGEAETNGVVVYHFENASK